jgi:hypothetical protein
MIFAFVCYFVGFLIVATIISRKNKLKLSQNLNQDKRFKLTTYLLRIYVIFYSVYVVVVVVMYGVLDYWVELPYKYLTVSTILGVLVLVGILSLIAKIVGKPGTWHKMRVISIFIINLATLGSLIYFNKFDNFLSAGFLGAVVVCLGAVIAFTLSTKKLKFIY